MKNFLKENWFKLMTGTSMLVFSFAFLLYVVSPTYANQTSENKTPKMESNEDYFAVASGGYLYVWEERGHMSGWSNGVDYNSWSNESFVPRKRKLP